MLIMFFVLPAALAVLAFAFRNRILNRIILIVYACLYGAAAVLALVGTGLAPLPELLPGYFRFDSLARLFLIVLAAVNFGVCLYSVHYLASRRLSRRQDTLYTAFLLLFLAAMTGGILTRHLGLLWVFIEATTLAGGVLISIENGKTALEAVWKYIFICSIGVAFSFIGIILLSLAGPAEGSLFFSDLYSGAPGLNPMLLKLAFAFILVGFGTKMGLAPVHAWLPDAHAEAPAPVSALLSGALLNIAFLGLLRFHPLMAGAGLTPFAGTLTLIMGILSLVVSAAFILRSRNYKRLLAYSSIENMGIMALGLGIGGPGLFAALLHMVVHSLAKAGLFLTSGNIYDLHHSKQSGDVRGLLRTDRVTGWLWIMGFVAIAGLPPFGAFWSKFFLIRALTETGSAWLIAPFFLMLVVIVFGMGRAVFGMAWGEAAAPPAGRPRLPVRAWLPQAGFLALLLLLGCFIPDFLRRLLEDACALLQATGVNP